MNLRSLIYQLFVEAKMACWAMDSIDALGHVQNCEEIIGVINRINPTIPESVRLIE